VLSFGENGSTGHAVFLYEKNGKYGSSGSKESFTEPIFSSEGQLAAYLFLKLYERYPKNNQLYWEVKDLSKLGNFIYGKCGKDLRAILIKDSEETKVMISEDVIIKKGQVYLKNLSP